jgi:fused signal recognition particle receptor
MSGFFKKLFNRIVGKKEEPTPEAVVEAQQRPAPEPAPAALPEPEPEAAPVIAKTEPEKRPAPKKPEPKKSGPKKAETKKPEPKKAELKKAEPKKPEPAKPEAKKKVEPKKVEAKKPAPKKPEPKKPEPKNPEAKKPVPAKAKQLAKRPPQPVEEKELPPASPPVIEQVVPEPPPPPVPEVITQPEPPPAPTPVVIRPPPPPPAPELERKGWFSRLKDGLSKSSKSLTGSITAIFTKRKLDAATLQELEDTLIQADLGITVSERIIKAVATGRYDKEIDPQEVKQILADEVSKVLKPVEVPFNFGAEKPFVILVVGVNGSGKTTTIGKLGAIAAREGFKVKFAACDTFRAAAIEQLTVWGKRIGAETISRPQGADAAGLAFDAMKAANEDGTEIVFIDTAGRLHNKTYLMDELDKVVRVIKKYDALAPHAVLLVLDATTGQNALAQAEAFSKVAGVTGLIMTKLDGTARGGILVAIAEKFKLPIHAIGVGESIDDLQPFDADAFSRAIAGLEERT